MTRLEGRVALVSGGARGLGAAHVEAFIAEGARVVIGDVLEEEGRALAAAHASSARFVELDVTSESSWSSAVETAMEWGGAVDVLVNNAGISVSRPLLQLSFDVFKQIAEVNYFGVFLGIKAVAPEMVRAGRGSIINISSVSGMMAVAGAIAYNGSKFAVRGLTKAAALELAPLGVRVNSVHPGVLNTPLSAGASPDACSLFDVPIGRIGEPSEVAQLSVFLASDAASYCTGSEFVVDGGWLAGRLNEKERRWIDRAAARVAGDGDGDR